MLKLLKLGLLTLLLAAVLAAVTVVVVVVFVGRDKDKQNISTPASQFISTEALKTTTFSSVSTVEGETSMPTTSETPTISPQGTTPTLETTTTRTQSTLSTLGISTTRRLGTSTRPQIPTTTSSEGTSRTTTIPIFTTQGTTSTNITSKMSTTYTQTSIPTSEWSTTGTRGAFSTSGVSTTEIQDTSFQPQTSTTTYSESTSIPQASTAQSPETTSIFESTTFSTSEALSTSTVTTVPLTETSSSEITTTMALDSTSTSSAQSFTTDQETTSTPAPLFTSEGTSTTIMIPSTSTTQGTTSMSSTSKMNTTYTQTTMPTSEWSTTGTRGAFSTSGVSTTEIQDTSSQPQTSTTTYSESTSIPQASTAQSPETTSIFESTTFSTSEALSTSTATTVPLTETSSSGITTTMALDSTSIFSTSSTSEPSTPGQKRCLVVGDFYNFGSNTTLYEKEKNFIAEISYGLLREKEVMSVGIWLYGNAKALSSLPDSLNSMRTSVHDLVEDLYKIEYAEVAKPLSTADAIKLLNQLEDPRNLVNCIVFLSAQKETSALPALDPDDEKSSITTIIAVGLDDVDLSKIVVPPRGSAVSVASDYSEQDVDKVIAAVVKRHFSTSATTVSSIPLTSTAIISSTKSDYSTTSEEELETSGSTFEFSTDRTPVITSTIDPTETATYITSSTSAPPKSDVHCLFVGDLLNFERNETAYERERQFIIDVGRRLFETTLNAKGVVWAYGYTNGPTGLRDVLTNMKSSFEQFEKNANTTVVYKDIKTPNLTNKGAIGNLNNASDKQRNANCMIFFSALTNPSAFKKLDPKGSNDFKRVVVVSLRGIDLSGLVVQPRGDAVKVTTDYSESDVTTVLDKVLTAF